MPVPFGMSPGLWHGKENSLNHRFYLPKVANAGDSGASLNQEAERQMSKVSKRKVTKAGIKKKQQQKKTLLPLKMKPVGFDG